MTYIAFMYHKRLFAKHYIQLLSCAHKRSKLELDVVEETDVNPWLKWLLKFRRTEERTYPLSIGCVGNASCRLARLQVVFESRK